MKTIGLSDETKSRFDILMARYKRLSNVVPEATKSASKFLEFLMEQATDIAIFAPVYDSEDELLVSIPQLDRSQPGYDPAAGLRALGLLIGRAEQDREHYDLRLRQLRSLERKVINEILEGTRNERRKQHAESKT